LRVPGISRRSEMTRLAATLRLPSSARTGGLMRRRCSRARR
jgi:hypothetical protein